MLILGIIILLMGVAVQLGVHNTFFGYGRIDQFCFAMSIIAIATGSLMTVIGFIMLIIKFLS